MMTLPNIVSHLHDHLRQWYGDSSKPPALQSETLKFYTPYTPQQADGWSYAMHLLLTSLYAIYQDHVHILEFGQLHVD